VTRDQEGFAPNQDALVRDQIGVVKEVCPAELNQVAVGPTQCSAREDAYPTAENQEGVRRIQVAERVDAFGAAANRSGVRLNRVPERRDARPVRLNRYGLATNPVPVAIESFATPEDLAVNRTGGDTGCRQRRTLEKSDVAELVATLSVES
jgi:hypothetical protein